MKILDNIYFEKGTEKYFYTIAEIEKSTSEAKEKYEQNRTLSKKLKHWFGSNQTVMEINEDLQKTYEEKMKTKKVLEISRILSDLLKRARFCCEAADFKSLDFINFYNKLEKEYIKLCEDYVTNSFEKADKMDNWEPVKQALAVLKGKNNDIRSQIDKIDNMIMLKKVLNNIEKTFSSFKFNYENSKLEKVKDEYLSISHLELKSEYKIFFEQIDKIVSDSFQKLTIILKTKIEKEKKQKTPSATFLMRQMSDYIKIEKDFELFSSAYRNHKYDEHLEKLKSFIESFNGILEAENKAFERICKINEPDKRIIEITKRNNKISNHLDQFILNYKEVIKERELLTNIQKEYQTELALYEEKIAYKGDLCLLENRSKHRYLFVNQDKIEFGRQSVPNIFYKDGKIFIPWNTISGNHGYIDLKSFIYYDNNSTNGSFSALSKTPKKKIDLKTDKDLNFGRHITFDFKFNDSYSSFKISWIDYKKIEHLMFYETPQDFLEIWAKLYFIIFKDNKPIFISKLDGKVFEKVEDSANFYFITPSSGKYYFTDIQNNIKDILIKKNGNKNMPLFVEKI
ncbi:MAG: hypothetical protein K8S23_17475 [Candidatus Cloacimonetes bacterium]|nr:hypothetical protein [Candidatus Cloacimonadota bacterium]